MGSTTRKVIFVIFVLSPCEELSVELQFTSWLTVKFYSHSIKY